MQKLTVLDNLNSHSPVSNIIVFKKILKSTQIKIVQSVFDNGKNQD